MPVFKIKHSKLVEMKQSPFVLEDGLHRLTEKNLNEVFGLELVARKFPVSKYEIDTLAFDRDSKCFVLIEYKRLKSSSVIDQGYTYLASVLDNKADCILEYNEQKNVNLKKNDVDWSQTRVLFLADSFTNYQRDAINFKNLPIELWEVKRYENQIINYNRVGSKTPKQSISDISTSKTTISKVSKEIKVYSVEDLIKPKWGKTKAVFEEIREKILQIDPRIEEKINQVYIGYKIDSNLLCSIHPFASKIQLDLTRVEKRDLVDPANRIKKIDWKRLKWGKACVYDIVFSGRDTSDLNIDIDYGLGLVSQVYKKYWK